jgi:hypothetical protein
MTKLDKHLTESDSGIRHCSGCLSDAAMGIQVDSATRDAEMTASRIKAGVPVNGASSLTRATAP